MVAAGLREPYKRLKTSGSGHALSARAYFPNRSVAEDLIDIHANKNGSGYSSNPFGYVLATNRETNTHPQSDTRWGYAYRPVRANYAPVLLGVNAIYSLVYSGNQLKMTVDPFFIIWNPYNTGITAEKFAITLENGFAGDAVSTYRSKWCAKIIRATERMGLGQRI